MMEVTERNVTSGYNQRSKFSDGDNWQTNLFIKVTWVLDRTRELATNTSSNCIKNQMKYANIKPCIQ